MRKEGGGGRERELRRATSREFQPKRVGLVGWVGWLLGGVGKVKKEDGRRRLTPTLAPIGGCWLAW